MKIRDLCVSFGEKQVLDHFTADFGPGITLLKAPSGYGKTTLLRQTGKDIPDVSG